MTASAFSGSVGAFPGRDGLELAYRCIGEGRPLVLLHVLDTFVETPDTALAEITTPTLVVAGDQDERRAAELAAALPGGRYVPVPGNHLTALLTPDLAPAILAFLPRRTG